MADYVPSAIVVGGAAVIIGLLYVMRAPLFLIMVVAIISFFLVLSQHRELFAADYRNVQILSTFAAYAPYILVTVVILASLFYIFFIAGFTRRPGVANVSYAAAPPANFPALSPNRNLNTLGNRGPLNNLGANFTSNRNRANFLSAIERAV
jgi:hypothetical protein